MLTKQTVECSGMLHNPGRAPVIPMLFPPLLGTGCCRSYLGQLQPSSSAERLTDLAEWRRQHSSMLNISHRMPQIHAEATLQRAGQPLACLRLYVRINRQTSAIRFHKYPCLVWERSAEHRYDITLPAG